MSTLYNHKELAGLLTQIDELERRFLDCASMIFKAGMARVENIDFIALSVINRAISLNKGYKLLVEANNTLSAVNLLRLQLDNLIRYNSLFVADEKDYVQYIIDGKPINKYQKGKQRFTDTYLAKELNKRFSKSYDLYTHLCEFIHFSERHISKVMTESDNENAIYRVIVGDYDNFNLKEKVDYTENLYIISINLLTLLEKWPKEKDLYNL